MRIAQIACFSHGLIRVLYETWCIPNPLPPARAKRSEGQALDLEELERLDSFGFPEAWIGEHFTSAWEPCPAPDLLISLRRVYRMVNLLPCS
jgi:hypothetical protein